MTTKNQLNLLSLEYFFNHSNMPLERQGELKKELEKIYDLKFENSAEYKTISTVNNGYLLDFLTEESLVEYFYDPANFTDDGELENCNVMDTYYNATFIFNCFYQKVLEYNEGNPIKIDNSSIVIMVNSWLEGLLRAKYEEKN